MRKVYANGHGRIVKFVEGRYGDTVHRFCAAKGIAPPLLSCELACPNSIWWRVEMEECELKSISEATNPDYAQSQLKLLLDELRANYFVHGDLRPPNVFLHGSQEKVALINFDYAGVAGVDVYPYEMNPEINWPEGAHGGAKLSSLTWHYGKRKKLIQRVKQECKSYIFDLLLRCLNNSAERVKNGPVSGLVLPPFGISFKGKKSLREVSGE